ncbi:integumentary mucin A.1-like, partial [Apis florea]|uniref:integumentary mucin A.1-like n=1 Tax=Apis florea TaxID=7463 RepID=UPI0006290F1D
MSKKDLSLVNIEEARYKSKSVPMRNHEVSYPYPFTDYIHPRFCADFSSISTYSKPHHRLVRNLKSITVNYESHLKHAHEKLKRPIKSENMFFHYFNKELTAYQEVIQIITTEPYIESQLTYNTEHQKEIDILQTTLNWQDEQIDIATPTTTVETYRFRTPERMHIKLRVPRWTETEPTTEDYFKKELTAYQEVIKIITTTTSLETTTTTTTTPTPETTTESPTIPTTTTTVALTTTEKTIATTTTSPETTTALTTTPTPETTTETQTVPTTTTTVIPTTTEETTVLTTTSPETTTTPTTTPTPETTTETPTVPTTTTTEVPTTTEETTVTTTTSPETTTT